MKADGLADSSIHQRSRRVAALAHEIARCLNLPSAQRETLDHAGLVRACSGDLLEPRTLDRLLADLAVPCAPAPAGGRPEVCRPQAPLRRPAVTAGEAEPALLRDVLEIAGFFQDRLEFLPYELVTSEQILDELGSLAEEASLNPAVVSALGGLQRVRLEQLIERVYRLPVFPLVALRALELSRSADADYGQIESLVSSDQVLAGRLIQAANSSLYGAGRRISSLRQAISYIGLEAAHKVLIAAVFHPLFASAGLHSLWRHSLEISQVAERLGAASACASREEAFLAGLVHDVGRLALQTASGEDVIAYARMLEKGCEPVFAEMVLCGFDHGAAGAGILRFWSFPEHLAQAVQDHHHPEHSTSELAAILYLAEFWSGSEEDLPSGGRLRDALKRVGLSWGQLAEAGPPRGGWADLLASAA